VVFLVDISPGEGQNHPNTIHILFPSDLGVNSSRGSLIRNQNFLEAVFRRKKGIGGRRFEWSEVCRWGKSLLGIREKGVRRGRINTFPIP
jgi:hypothetical protein